MNSTKSQAKIVARRAELLAELFLQDLGATFVSDPKSETGYDFIVAFPNHKGGTNFSGVEVESTERPLGDFYQLNTRSFKRLARSNIPSLLLVVDAKHNRLYHTWPREVAVKVPSDMKTVRVPVMPIDDEAKEKIRERLGA